MSALPTNIPAHLAADNPVIEHVERVTSEHARMADLLRDLYAAHYGSEAAAIRTAHEYGLDPSAHHDWRNVLRQVLEPEVDALLTEVHAAAEGVPC